jgi:hypothetical protein
MFLQKFLKSIQIPPARTMREQALSQKQFWKYFSAEIFPASMAIVPVLFKKISIQQHPRKKYL